jgi:hypothetical protein
MARDADQDVFDRSPLACESVGWGYRRAGALDPVLRANRLAHVAAPAV